MNMDKRVARWFPGGRSADRPADLGRSPRLLLLVARGLRSAFDDEIEWVPRILRQRAKPEGNWSLSRAERWAHTVKLLICLMLRRGADESRCQHRMGWHEQYKIELAMREPDHVEVAYQDLGSFQNIDYGTVYDFRICSVGHGWRHWHYDVTDSSSC